MGFFSMFKKGDPPPPKEAKAPPPATKMQEFRDETTGVAYIPQKDGSHKLVRLPRSPEMQEMHDQGLQLIRDGINSLVEISNNYPDLVPSIAEPLTVLTDTMNSKRNELSQVLNMPNFEQHLATLRETQTRLINQHYDAGIGEGLNRLASMGYGAGSTVASSFIDMGRESKENAFKDMEAGLAQKALDYQSQYNQNAAQRANTVVGLNDSIAQNALNKNQLENQQFGMQQETADKKFVMKDTIGNKGIDMLRYDTELPLKSNAFQNAFALKQAEDNYNLNATRIENESIAQNNAAQLAHHNAKSEPFLGQLAKAAVMAYAGGGMGGLGGLAGGAGASGGLGGLGGLGGSLGGSLGLGIGSKLYDKFGKSSGVIPESEVGKVKTLSGGK